MTNIHIVLYVLQCPLELINVQGFLSPHRMAPVLFGFFCLIFIIFLSLPFLAEL